MNEPACLVCLQLAPDVEDPASSARRVRAAIEAAIGAGADIVLLPELAPCGYVFASEAEVRAVAQPADGELLAGWAHAAAARDAVVIGGFAELAADGRVFNSAALVDGHGVRAVYRKLHLWDAEQRWFSPGEAPAPVVDTRFGRIGLGICYDIEFPELTRGLALAGAQLIALPANWPYEPPPPGERPILMRLAMATAYLNHVYVAVCDRAGQERGIRFQGASVIAGPAGTALAQAEPAAAESATGAEGEGLAGNAAQPADTGDDGLGGQRLVARVDLTHARDKRLSARNDAFADRRPEHYFRGLRG